ncbi:hypothetical protein CLU79DRAFT_862510 [Phycomyces nitens]|nr:hypothetical protein CLU79DRAFT_862510 [Phycomyces nitens]
MDTSTIHYILITNGESYTGHTLAWYIANQIDRQPGRFHKKNWKVRVLCESLKNMKDLEGMGIDIKEVDYSSQFAIRDHMKNVKCAIFVPAMSDHRVRYGINVLDAAAEEKLKCIQMISICSSEQGGSEHKSLGQYRQLEEHLRTKFAYGRWCVFRIPLLYQLTYFWSGMVQDKGKLCLPLSDNTYFPAIDVLDLCDASATLLLSPRKQSEGNELDDEPDIPDQALKRIYHLSSSHNYTGKIMTESLNKGLQDEETSVEYEKISSKDMRDYLEKVSSRSSIKETISSIAENIQKIPSYIRRASGTAEDATNQELLTSCEMDVPALLPNPGHYLNSCLIELMMDLFENIEKYPQEYPTHDLQGLIGHDPKRFSEFFADNRKHFQPSTKKL